MRWRGSAPPSTTVVPSPRWRPVTASPASPRRGRRIAALTVPWPDPVWKTGARWCGKMLYCRNVFPRAGGNLRADALRLHLRGIVAIASGAGGVAGGAVAGDALAAGAGLVLCRTARRRSGRARGRTRVPARHLSRPAARVLARRAGFRAERPKPRRRLRAVPDLHRGHLLGGVRARALDRRRPARGSGGAADGRHRRLHGADAGFRAGHSHHAVVGDHSPALLARSGRAPARLLAPARGRDRAAAAHDLCRTDPGRIAGAVHAGQQAGARRPQLLRRGDCGGGRRDRDGAASDLACRFGRGADAGAGTAAHSRSGGRQSAGLAAPDRIDLRRPCRAQSS